MEVDYRSNTTPLLVRFFFALFLSILALFVFLVCRLARTARPWFGDKFLFFIFYLSGLCQMSPCSPRRVLLQRYRRMLRSAATTCVLLDLFLPLMIYLLVFSFVPRLYI